MPTRIKPAPVAYPNGGGLQAMANKTSKVQQLERDALEAKHEVDRAKLAEKHEKQNKPKPVVRKKSNGKR